MASEDRLKVVLCAVQRLRQLHYAQPGISFLDFAKICMLPGLDSTVVSSLIQPVTFLQDAALSVEKGAECVKTILQTMVEKTACFTTLQHFIWLIRTTIAAQLIGTLADKMVQLIPLLSKLLAVIKHLNQTTYTNTADVIAAVTVRLKEDIPLPNNNLVCIIYRLSLVNCTLFYYTSVALIFAGLDEIMCNGLVTYRMQGPGDLIVSLFAFDLMYKRPNDASWDYEIFRRVVLLLHLYQLVVIECQILKSEQELVAEHGPYAECFRIKYKNLEMICRWLNSLFPEVLTGNWTTPLDELVYRHLIPMATAQHQRCFVLSFPDIGSVTGTVTGEQTEGSRE